MTISDTDLQALIDAEAKATKGEWKLATVAATVGKRFHVFVYVQHLGEVCSCSPNSGLYSNRCGLDNLDFIAAIRNAAPSLLAELRASREIIKRMPRTKDGVLVVVGDGVWITPDHILNSTNRPILVNEAFVEVSECYSTCEAALASKGEQ